MKWAASKHTPSLWLVLLLGVSAATPAGAADVAVRAVRHAASATTAPGARVCRHVLDRAWDAFERSPCSDTMQAQLEASDSLAGTCGRLPEAHSFVASRQELDRQTGLMCGAHIKPCADRSSTDAPPYDHLREAEKKLGHLANHEKQELHDHPADPDEDSVVSGVTTQELKKDVEIAQDFADSSATTGHVNDDKDLNSVQVVLDSQNLCDGLECGEVESGTGMSSSEVANVVTVEDNRALSTTAMGKEPDDIPLQENLPDPSARKNHVIVQGDMRVPMDTSATAHVLLRGASRSVPRVAAGDIWPGGRVPYCFAHDISPAAKRSFLEAVEHIRNSKAKGCLKFVEVQPGSGDHCKERSGLYVQSRESGTCWSDVGYAGIGNALNLGYGCEYKGIALHELGHTLGMDHEQARPDRGEFVRVVWENMQIGLEDQFEINPQAYTKEPYDYLSIMHYGAYTFSKDRARKPTIVTVEGAASAALGQSMGFSNSDVKQLGDMYCPLEAWVGDLGTTMASNREKMLRKVRGGTPIDGGTHVTRQVAGAAAGAAIDALDGADDTVGGAYKSGTFDSRGLAPPVLILGAVIAFTFSF